MYPHMPKLEKLPKTDEIRFLKSWVGGPDFSVALHIYVATQFLPATVRLISGGAELLLGVRIIEKLDITVGFGKRKFQIGQGEWQAMTRNK